MKQQDDEKAINYYVEADEDEGFRLVKIVTEPLECHADEMVLKALADMLNAGHKMLWIRVEWTPEQVSVLVELAGDNGYKLINDEWQADEFRLTFERIESDAPPKSVNMERYNEWRKPYTTGVYSISTDGTFSN